MRFVYLFLALVALAFAISACEPQQRTVCRFEEGSMVKSVVTGAKGQVRYVSQYFVPRKCEYQVRFPSNQFFTDSRVLSNDGPITAAPLTTIWMKEFEIE